MMGGVDTVGNFTTPFDLQGTLSFARGIAGYNPFALNYSPSFCASSAQAQATTQYLGVNGMQTLEGATVFLTPQNAKIVSAYIAVDSTPASGQTYTFTVRVNGSDVGTPLVVNNGGFGGAITVAVNVTQYDRITIKSVFSATSGSATPRGLVNFTA
jgi:hypothetical protein